MSSFTLDDIRAAAEQKYGSLDIDLGDKTVRLLNALRLPKEDRKALSALQDRLDTDSGDAEEVLTEALIMISENDTQAEWLLEAVDGDLAVMAEIFERWVKGSQSGEASASES